MRRPEDCGKDEAETFRKYETMHLKIIIAILCLSLVLVQAGEYAKTRVEVIHPNNGKRGSGSDSSNEKGSSSRSGSRGSGEKKRYRRSAESLEGDSSLED